MSWGSAPRGLHDFRYHTGVGLDGHILPLAEDAEEMDLWEIVLDELFGGFLIFVRGYGEGHSFFLKRFKYMRYRRGRGGLSRHCAYYNKERRASVFFPDVRFVPLCFGQGSLEELVDSVSDKETVFVGIVLRVSASLEGIVGGSGKVGDGVEQGSV